MKLLSLVFLSFCVCLSAGLSVCRSVSLSVGLSVFLSVSLSPLPFSLSQVKFSVASSTFRKARHGRASTCSRRQPKATEGFSCMRYNCRIKRIIGNDEPYERRIETRSVTEEEINLKRIKGKFVSFGNEIFPFLSSLPVPFSTLPFLHFLSSWRDL